MRDEDVARSLGAIDEGLAGLSTPEVDALVSLLTRFLDAYEGVTGR